MFTVVGRESIQIESQEEENALAKAVRNDSGDVGTSSKLPAGSGILMEGDGWTKDAVAEQLKQMAGSLS